MKSYKISKYKKNTLRFILNDYKRYISGIKPEECNESFLDIKSEKSQKKKSENSTKNEVDNGI